MPNNISCSAFGQTAMAPDYSTCQAFQFSYGIQFLKIEFFCFFVSATVILISLFGKIKESYKWFILNQAIWDLVVEYDYVCNKPAYWTEMDNFNPAILKPPSTCIYYVDRFASNYLIGIRDAVTYLINFLPLSMLFLLSLSRFLAIFKHDFYKRHDSWIKILIVIVFANLASAFLISFYTLRLRFIAGYCQDLYCIGTTRTGKFEI